MNKFNRLIIYIWIVVHVLTSSVFAYSDATVNDASCLAPDSYFHDYDVKSGKTMFGVEGIKEITVQGVKKILLYPVRKAGNKLKDFFLSRTNMVMMFSLLLFFIMPQSLMGQSDEIANIAERTLMEERLQNDLKFPIFDGYRLVIKRKELGRTPELDEGHIEGPFNAYVDTRAQQTFDHKFSRIIEGLNFEIYSTLDRELIKKNGDSSTVYHSIIEIGERYGIDPQLLMTHTVMERWDRQVSENESDLFLLGRLFDSSKGNFQMKITTIYKAVRNIYERFPDEDQRNQHFPLLTGYSSFAEFKEEFHVERYLDLDKTSEQEIEIVCILLWDQYFSLTERFPGYFKDDFLTNPLSRFATVEEENSHILWTFVFSADISNYEGMTPYEIFVNSSENMPGVYTWARVAPIIYSYIKNISEKYGYEGLQYDDFINISAESPQYAAEISAEDQDFIKRMILLALTMFAFFVFVPPLLFKLAEKIDAFYDNYNPFKDLLNDDEEEQVLLEDKREIKLIEDKRETAVKEDVSLKKIKMVLPFIFDIEDYKPSKDKANILDYLEEVGDFIKKQIKKNPELSKKYGLNINSSQPDVFERIIISENHLKNSYGLDFIIDYRLFFPADEYPEITLARLIAYLKESKSIAYINRNDIEIAA